MAESIQHKLDRIRPPRVQITYDVEIGNAIEMKELPFVVGIMADLSGMPEKPLPRLKERKFAEIDRDNFNDILSSIQPRLALRVRNTLEGDDSETNVELHFSTLDDFTPINIVRQVPALSSLYDIRSRLKDMITKLDGNDELEAWLKRLMTDGTVREEVKGTLPAEGSESTPGAPESTLETLYVEGKLIRDESQRAFAESLVREFVTQVDAHADTAGDAPVAFMNAQIADIDQKIQDQLNAVMHDPAFQALEGTWRGLNYLVMNTETGTQLKLRLLNATKKSFSMTSKRPSNSIKASFSRRFTKKSTARLEGTPIRAWSEIIRSHATRRTWSSLTKLLVWQPLPTRRLLRLLTQDCLTWTRLNSSVCHAIWQKFLKVLS